MDYSELYCIVHALRDIAHRTLVLADELNERLARRESDDAQDIDTAMGDESDDRA